jgi:hypothetical protein
LDLNIDGNTIELFSHYGEHLMIALKPGPKLVRRYSAILIASICFILFCSTGNFRKSDVDPYWDDLARFLAGMPLSPGSKFTPRLNKDYVKNHAAVMDEFRIKILNEISSHITPWRKANIPEKSAKNTAFYPFSGADFINLYTFFPEAKNYIMMALEGSGPVPDPITLSDKNLSSGLASVKRNVMDIVGRNYFRDAVMNREMKNKNLLGTTPVLLAFAAILGLTVTSVESVFIDSEGNVRVQSETAKTQDDGDIITGTRIFIMSPSDRRPRSLLYLKVRLGNSAMDAGTSSGKFFKKIGPLNTMLKSAVYLLRWDKFSDLRDFIMAGSGIIVQDDTGVPYRFLEKSLWEINLFGRYTRGFTLSDLKNPLYQPELAKDFRDNSKPLEFHYGYGSWRGKGMSNILVAIKRPAAGSE